MSANNVVKRNADRHPLKIPALDLVPGYWRGRARTSRLFAEKARQAGDMRGADELDRQALRYESKADELARAPAEQPAAADRRATVADRSA